VGRDVLGSSLGGHRLRSRLGGKQLGRILRPTGLHAAGARTPFKKQDGKVSAVYFAILV
jgi:hypothetical protein